MIGARLGPYHLLKDLGAGGMGRVYLAEAVADTQGVTGGTWVALKVLHPHLAERRAYLTSFFRESTIGQAVRHPNVVKTLAAGVLASSGKHFHYLAMEYVEGQTLRGLLDDLGRVPEELCRHIGREIAQGLGAIHSTGAIHRDLKPENILITRDHAVKIMDFGAASFRAQSAPVGPLQRVRAFPPGQGPRTASRLGGGGARDPRPG